MTQRDRYNRVFDRTRRDWRGRGGVEGYYEANHYFEHPESYPREDFDEDWDEDYDNLHPWRPDENPHYRHRGPMRGYQQHEWQGRRSQRGAQIYDAPRHRSYREEGRRYRHPLGQEDHRPGYSQFDEDADYGYHVDPRTHRSMRDQSWSDYEGYDRSYGAAGMRSDEGMDYVNENEYGRDQGYESPGQEFSRRRDYGRQEAQYQGSRGENYTGMGPQAYRRSDTRIEEEVCERLTMHGRVDARSIEIEVKDGEVTLRGFVPSREMKRLAEDSAAYVRGVRDVQNDIRIRQQVGNREIQGQQTENIRSTERYSDDRRIDQPDSRYTENRSFEDPEKDKRREFDDRRLDEPSAPVDTTLESELSSETQFQQHEEPLTDAARLSQLRPEMQVIGRDGKLIGRVKETRDGDFLVNRELARDVYVPFHAVLSIGETVMVNVEADAVNDQDWEMPSLL